MKTATAIILTIIIFIPSTANAQLDPCSKIPSKWITNDGDVIMTVADPLKCTAIRKPPPSENPSQYSEQSQHQQSVQQPQPPIQIAGQQAIQIQYIVVTPVPQDETESIEDVTPVEESSGWGKWIAWGMALLVGAWVISVFTNREKRTMDSRVLNEAMS